MATFGPQQVVKTSIDKVPVTLMTDEQIARLHGQVEEVRALKLPVLHDAKDPHSRMYVMTLDGTQNDAINDPQHKTNIGLIDANIQNTHGKKGSVLSQYESGVGNQKLLIGLIDSAIGFTVNEQAKDAYIKFITQANKWHQEDPDVKISLAGIGFSRGASALMIASNMVHKKGIPDFSSRYYTLVTDPITRKSHTEIDYSRYLVPPGQVPQALILNDQVATGKAEDMDRRVAPSVVSVVQLMAVNENRAPFPFYSAEDPQQMDPRIHTFKFTGAHSDIGGGYLLNGISSVTRQVNEIILNKYGAGIPESLPETAPEKYVIHDSEYLWGNRDLASPTPPLEMQSPRNVIYDKGPGGDGLKNPTADKHLLQKYEPSADMTLKKHLLQNMEFTPEQYALVIARIQENLSISKTQETSLQIT